MQATQTLIVGVIAVLVGIVLIGPVVSSVQGLTVGARCPVGGTAPHIGLPPGNIQPVSSNELITRATYTNLVGPGRVDYAPSTLCTTTGNLAFIAADGLINAVVARSTYQIDTVTGATTPGHTGGALGGADNAATRSLAILIPLIFVAGIMGVPIWMIWGKLRGASA